VIVGLLVLFTVSIVFIVWNNSSFQEGLKIQTPLQAYLDSCLEYEAEHALRLSLAQGGRLSAPIDSRQMVSQSDGFFVPYWFYDGKNVMPTMQQVEEELEEFLVRSGQTCFAQVRSNVDTVRDASLQRVNVSLAKENVRVEFMYEVVATDTNARLRLEKSTLVVPYPVKTMLEEAQDIALDVYGSNALGNITLDLMAAADPLIPMSNMIVSCQPVKWKFTDVRANLLDIITQNIPKVQIRFAQHTPFLKQKTDYSQSLARLGVSEEDYAFSEYTKFDSRVEPDSFLESAPTLPPAPADMYNYAHLFLDAGDASELKNQNLKVFFEASSSYPLELSISPMTSKQELKPSVADTSRQYLRYLCMQFYHFTYDVKYPVKVYVQKTLPNDETLVLQFALPVRIAQNTPVLEERSLLTRETVVDQALCEDTVAAPISIIARRFGTDAPLSDVDIEYSCLYKSCSLGKTDAQTVQLTSALPGWCSNGQLTASKSGYLSQTLNVTPQTEGVQFTLLPLKSVQTTVVLGPSIAPDLATVLRPTQKAYITLLSVTPHGVHETFALVNGTTKGTITLIDTPLPTVYNASVLVFDEKDQLIGGYENTFTLEQLYPDRVFTLHAYDFVTTNQDLEYERLAFLTDNQTYKADYVPAWVRK
jgi:hypothetical protein